MKAMKKIEMVPIHDIQLTDRYRTADGDLEALAQNIQEVGLLEPIGIDRRRRLIFGGRRLMACLTYLNWKTIPAVTLNLESILRGQYSENEFRKQFLASERKAIGQAIEQEELAHRKKGRPAKNPVAGKAVPKKKVDHGPPFREGKTRDIAGKRAGFKSGKQYERVKKVVDQGAPELIQAMDQEDVSITAAATIAVLPKEEQKKIVEMPPEERSGIVKRIRRTQADREADERHAQDLLTFRGLYDAIKLLANHTPTPQDTWEGFSRVCVYDVSEYLPRAIACLVRLDKEHPNEPRKPVVCRS
jgi:ParB-like chromosome segregation protein Spo0J